MENLQSTEILSLSERILSTRNRLFWTIRSSLRFQRTGYKERGSEAEHKSFLEKLNAEDRGIFQSIENRYKFANFREKLSLETYKKNIASLWALEQFPELKSLHGKKILEPGCQDFSRLPAWKNFFAGSTVEGLEIDPYPILNNFHSRSDKANYYINLTKSESSYSSGDFFQCSNQYDLILSFYPFVSTNPALSWGLPAKFGNPYLWLESFERCLSEQGILFVVHQGSWEEETFDAARKEQQWPFELLSRKSINCPFYPMPYPPHASLYRKLE